MATEEEAGSPGPVSNKSVSELAQTAAVEDSVDALLRAAGDDPLTAIAAAAEAVFRRNNGKFAGADAVLYRTLQAQLSGKYRSVLEAPPGASGRNTGSGGAGKKGAKAGKLSDGRGDSSSPYTGSGRSRKAGASPSKMPTHKERLSATEAEGGEHAAAKGSPRLKKAPKPPPVDVDEASQDAEAEAEADADEAADSVPQATSPRLGRSHKAASSISARQSLKGLRSISAPIPPRPPKARSMPDKFNSTLGSPSNLPHSARVLLESPDKRSTREYRAGSTVDIHSWLLERKRKEKEREEMRLARLKSDARFIEKLDERQTERNKLLQEEQERMAQNVAGKKGQKWKPVPFTPWPETNKGQTEVVTEDVIFQKDVQRLFGAIVIDDKASPRLTATPMLSP